MKNMVKILSLLWVCLLYSQLAFGSNGNTHKNSSESYPFILTSATAPESPPAGFTYITNGGCVPVIVQFQSQLSGPSYFWTFGDGGTSTDCNPLHTYTTPGVYTVTLVATGGTYTTTITVGANPVVTFLGDSVSCLGDVKTYNVSSTIPAVSYSWNAQGGAVSSPSVNSATVTWTTYGVNYLNYTITTAAGCTKIFTYKVKVIPPPDVNLPCCDKRQTGTPNKANAAPPDQHEQVPGGPEPCSVCAGSYACYKATINPEFGLPSDYDWIWTVTNGTIVSINGDSTEACVVWGSTGTGTIKLTMIDKRYGCTTVKECEVEITPGISPVFNVNGTCISSPVNFDASLTSPIADVVDFYWEFGDGYTENTAAPFTSHTYTYTGTYTATLTITTQAGCKYKVSKTFNMISGTRPTIVCPGTVCEKSRQCYSTTAIAGATYVWSIIGDDSTQRVVNGNEVCVTWGSGPVGTVIVAVIGGGYTCTNFASESVAIVGSVIPIAGPDFICQNTGFVQVSTTNYAGACYRWRINGAAQSSATNEMSFNAAAFGSPITIEVDVDFPLGCCHGSGKKIIKKLPEYGLFPYTYDVCIGSTVTYFMNFPAGTPSPAVSWSVEGGTITASTSNSVTITWNTVGIGTITAGNNTPTVYCNDGTNNTWQVKVWDKATGEDISGPNMVCASSTTQYTYYHGFEYPTGSASVSVTSPGSVIPGTYSSNIIFPSPGIYTITVTYNHAVTFCPSTKTYTVKVVSPTPPTFTIPPGVVCEGDVVTYSAPVADTSYYTFQAVGGSIISQSYSAGILTLQIQWNSTVTSGIMVTNKACGTSNTQNITVNGRPVVIISQSPVVCGSTSSTLSVAPIWSSYNWSTGSTSSSTPVFSPGTYSVTVFNAAGCPNTGSITVNVITPVAPVINSFTVTPPPTNYCPKFNTICANITPGSGSIVSYNWTFTGFTATSSSAACPSVALASNPGTGNWTLTVTDSYGCTATNSGTLSDACTTVINPPCSTAYAATFNILSYNPCNGQFTTTGTNYSAVYWDFGDGTTGSGGSPTHIYSSPCNKVVNCIVVDINNCAKLFTFNISVPYTIYNPTVTATNNICTGAVQLSANGLSICPGSGLTPTYSWTITPSAGGSPVYTSSGPSSTLNVGSITTIPPGNYTASVTMVVSGCSATVSTSFNKGGLQAFFASCGGCVGSPLTFIDQSTPYSAPIIQWTWNISGPASFNSFLQNPTINFTVAGTYTVILTVIDNNLCTHSDTNVINVLPPFVPGPIVVKKSGSPQSGTMFNICPGENYTLEAPPGTTYQWSNGATTQIISITEPGIYSVTVFNASNCAAKVGPITFYFKPAPEAIIIPSGNDCSPRLLRAFKGTGYTYSWNYPFPGYSASYIFLPATQSVTLQVTNVHGCSASTTQMINVNPSPTASVSYAPQPFCGSTVTLTASPSGGTPPYTHLWNNGVTTTSFSTATPGLYIYEVKDNNGCTAKVQLNLQPVLPSGMDLLPYGCYDVCGPVSFCAGTMPWGWTGQWYNGTSAVPGGFIPQNGNIAITFSSPGTYTLHYTPVNPSVACTAISKPITINFIAMPQFTITTSTGSNTICRNGQTMILTVNPQDPSYSYEWYLNGGGPVGTGFTYTATQGGTYTVIITKNPCCRKQVTIIIEEEDCCFENPGVPFQQILNPITVSSTEFWFDKYYIDATVTVTGELDLTNVDCVFGPRGEIVVTGQGFLRCNNSVLRPCHKDSIWKGVTFAGDGASGWINTTTIKNAIIGVNIVTNYTGVRLTDNTFIKCQTSVNLTDAYNQQSISGNTFEIDETRLPYPSSPTQYWAIRMKNAQVKGLIAQNQFRHVQPKKTSNIYYGIYSEYASFTASENMFNDMWRAIDVSNNWDVVAIEENEIKLNTLKESYDRYQIRVTNCENPVLIYENRMDNGISDNSQAGAIYCEHTYRTHVKDNTINGFLVSIIGVRTNDLHITSNKVTSNTSSGIAVVQTDRSIISCNTVNSMATNLTQSGGQLLGISDWSGNGSSQIFANCIFNMHTAIFLTVPNAGYNLPALVNNYMYNYTENGIYNDFYNGNIGVPGGATNAGRNTFMSNNGATGSTFDINSSNTIFEAGNYGILMTNNVVSTSGQNEYYSTAACGQQIEPTYPNNQLDKYNTCDVYHLDKWIDKTADGKYTLIRQPGDMTAGAIDDHLQKGETEVLGMITAQMQKGKEDAKRAADAVLSSRMDKNLAARLLTTNALAIVSPQLAATFMAMPQLKDINGDLKEVLNTVISASTTRKLNDQQVISMTSIDDQNSEYSPLAREIMQAINGGHDYKFYRLPAPEFQKPTNILVRANDHLKIYPVPATQSHVFLEYSVKEAQVQGLKVISAIGAEVANYDYTVQAGIVKLDISTLAPGVYSVILITDSKSNSLMTGRFVKVR